VHLDTLGLLDGVARLTPDDLVGLGLEALSPLRLLDVLLELFVFLATHLVHLLLGKTRQVLHHLLSSLGLAFLGAREHALDDLLPEVLHVGAPLASAFRLVDAPERVLRSTHVNRIGRVHLKVDLGGHLEEVGHQERPIELTGQLLAHRREY